MPEPAELWLVRHGQSQGNVVRERPRVDQQETLDIADRDMDVPLSELGVEQAAALGRWLAGQSAVPDVVVASPYLRAAQTSQGICTAAGLGVKVHLDERLRERELGILDLLTWHGVRVRFPGEARRRERLGKFYHRPPGGESWVDVALRLRSLRDSLAREHGGRRGLLVNHEVVVVVMRYLLEELDEQQALAISRDRPLANCSLTRFVTGDEGHLVLERENWTAPLEQEDTPVTEEPDAPVAPR